MPRTRVHTGAPWEARVGYCRALRTGDQIVVTGTVAIDPDGSTHAPGDGYAQAKRCLSIIEAALHELGAELRHVVRTRMFVTDIDRWEDFGRAHAERFAEHPPVTTMVEVSRLIRGDLLIEIEADAIVDDPAE
jgi:enamine deaminase RidA (YjgF/YER057c/UK114 family)